MCRNWEGGEAFGLHFLALRSACSAVQYVHSGSCIPVTVTAVSVKHVTETVMKSVHT